MKPTYLELLHRTHLRYATATAGMRWYFLCPTFMHEMDLAGFQNNSAERNVMWEKFDRDLLDCCAVHAGSTFERAYSVGFNYDNLALNSLEANTVMHHWNSGVRSCYLQRLQGLTKMIAAEEARQKGTK